MADDRRGTAGGSNKVDRVISKRELSGLGAELERRWLGEGTDRMSTRDLADLFNRRVLERAIEESDVFTLSGEVSELYASLTGDGGGDTTLVRSRLEENGIDVEAVEADFVSHQTVYRYLRNVREVERTEPTDEERLVKAVDTVQRLRGRTSAVTEQTVANLRDNGSLTVGEFDVLVDVQVLCADCGRSYDAAELLDRGSCECGE